ncbi:hypothetical protein NQ315_000671 [Exocentrus adspersus]|uniref:Uncharacterized protein n=1 Tax=Exocentrus adspersus TaxID=1586481 RepID=A0AAV8VNP2_9CUCU|nr:hypothetical protein NQ315_000671 [Exocentrus adspersus]
MKYFVKKVGETYGHDFISHNVHNLLHLADDVLNYGKLDNFSSFPFEKKSEKPLQRIIKRISESSIVKKCTGKNDIHLEVELVQEHHEGHLLQNFTRFTQHKVLKGKTFMLKTKEPDCFVQLQNSDIIKIVNLITYQHANRLVSHFFNSINRKYKFNKVDLQKIRILLTRLMP